MLLASAENPFRFFYLVKFLANGCDDFEKFKDPCLIPFTKLETTFFFVIKDKTYAKRLVKLLKKQLVRNMSSIS